MGVKPLCSTEFMDTMKTRVDTRLCFGAVLFGIGWGLAANCASPALTSLTFGDP